MPVLGTLGPEDLEVVEGYLQPVAFAEGDCIFRQGDPGRGCYVIDEGEVRLELEDAETDTDEVLGYLGSEGFLGELGLLDGKPRSASAYAHTAVRARWLSVGDFDALCGKYPRVGLALLRQLGLDVTGKLRRLTDQFAGYAFADRISPEINAMVSRAVAAQRAFGDWPEERVDALLRDVGETISRHAEELAAATVEETGVGVVEHKATKIRFFSTGVCAALLGQTGVGWLQTDEDCQVTEIATPMGVVLGLIPMTNPVPTLVFKTLICLKTRNALIASSHRRALGVGNRAGEIIQSVLRQHGAPPDLVQWLRDRTSREITSMLMRHPDVSFILATGGPSMVKAAYSSGTPAIGVGPGNAPAWVCADADLKATAEMVVGSKSFDNGILCGSENNLVVDARVRPAFVHALVANGAAVLTPDETGCFSAHALSLEQGRLVPEVIGQTAARIAQGAGIRRQEPIRLIVVPVELNEADGAYGREKLAPILSLFTVYGEEEGLAFCRHLLLNEGMGHTAIIHTANEALADRFAREMPANRILVNTPGSQGCCGISTGLTPSATLGCGTLGGSSTSDNVTFTHLRNIKRVAHGL